MADEPRVGYETVHDGMIAVVALNRPRYRNALSRQTIDELDAAFKRATEDGQVRVIVLKGEGPHFSSGADLGSPDAQPRGPEADRIEHRYAQTSEYELDCLFRFRAIPKPTIAQVHGYCIYFAFSIASTMDVIFAADDAQFLSTDLEFFSSAWDLGARKTKELLYENRFLPAREALEHGFVQRVYPAAELDERVLEYARRVCDQDPFRLRVMKASINQMEDLRGFSNFIRSHQTAFLVSRAASPSLPGQQEDGHSRSRHATLARAKSHQDQPGP